MASRLATGIAVFWALSTGLTGCVADDPFDFGGPRSCDPQDQNEWLYGLMEEAYLFNEDLPDVDIDDFETPADLIRALRTGVDRWSRVSDLQRTQDYYNEGKVPGIIGISTQVEAESGQAFISYVQKGSPADAAGLQRSDRIVSINATAIEEIIQNGLWGSIYGPNEEGVEVDIEVESSDGERHEYRIAKGQVNLITVPVHKVLDDTGYLYFSTFVSPSAAELDQAFATFRQEGVTRLVVDLRYNGGGLVNIAHHLINLIVGGIAHEDVAYFVRYNDNFSHENSTQRISAEDQTLSDIEHVAFLTTAGTASASELVINSVRAHTDVSVIGSSSAGKPVGSRHFPFCDKVAAPITFELLNADEEGRYFDGIAPTCGAVDDLRHVLGDPDEAMLATAITIMDGGSCPAALERPVTPTFRLAPQTTQPLLFPGIEELRGWL